MPDVIVWTIIFAVIATIFAGTGAFSFIAMKASKHKAMLVAALVWSGFSAVMFYFLATSQGYDGILYILIWLGTGAPTAAGLLIGGLSGWFKRPQVLL